MGGDLKPGTLLLAYGNGIFPWTTRPITWWSPDPRAIIPLGGLHVSRSLRKVLRKPAFTVTFDRAFRAGHGGLRRAPPGTQGDLDQRRRSSPAYTRLHELGHAHSVEVWEGERLVGGLYGVSIGGFFAGESMFSAEENASKVALVAMEEKLRLSGFELFDVQFVTPHLARWVRWRSRAREYLRAAARGGRAGR